MLKQFVLSTLCLSVLSACGGASSDPTDREVEPELTPLPEASEKVVKVIDGYLSGANICVVSEGNNECEPLGTTDEQGRIRIESTRTGRLIATIEAGKTKDADRIGFVPYSYQMIADITDNNEIVITPYTTLDVLDTEKNMADIAADLNLPVEIISGDYISSTSPKQLHVHALARALTSQFSLDVNSNEVKVLHDKFRRVNNYINNELSNNGTQLNKVNIVINDNKLEHERAIEVLEDYLVGTLYMFSTNFDAYRREGIRSLEFSDGQVSLAGREPQPYSIDGDKVSFGGEVDVFIYASATLGLQVPMADKDLIVTSTSNIQSLKPWRKEDFVGKTYYLLYDDALCDDNCDFNTQIEPEPTLIELNFSETKVTFNEAGNSYSVGWMIDNGRLLLELTSIGNDRDIMYSQGFADDNVIIAMDKRGRAPSLILTDKSLAEAIHYKWLKLQ